MSNHPKQRLEFQCWNCKRSYQLTLEVAGKPLLLIACPFCGKEAEADLNPYRSRPITLMRGTGEDYKTDKTGTLSLPKCLPTRPPTGKDNPATNP